MLARLDSSGVAICCCDLISKLLQKVRIDFPHLEPSASVDILFILAGRLAVMNAFKMKRCHRHLSWTFIIWSKKLIFAFSRLLYCPDNCVDIVVSKLSVYHHHHHHFLLERRPKRRLSKEARRVSKEAGEIPVEDGHSSGEQSTIRQTTPSQFLGKLSKLSLRKFITVRRCLTCYRRKWTVWLRKLFPIKIYPKN